MTVDSEAKGRRKPLYQDNPEKYALRRPI